MIDPVIPVFEGLMMEDHCKLDAGLSYKVRDPVAKVKLEAMSQNGPFLFVS